MLRGVFFLLYFVTNCDALADLMHFDWDFAVFNAGLLCVLGGVQMIRRFRSPKAVTSSMPAR